MSIEETAAVVEKVRVGLYRPAASAEPAEIRNEEPANYSPPAIVPPVKPQQVPAPAEIFVGAGESIQAAIDAAPAGTAIVIGPGTFTENIVLKSGISLQGAGANQTIIIAANAAEPVISGTADNVSITEIRVEGAAVGIEIAGQGIEIGQTLVTSVGKGIVLTGGPLVIIRNKIVGAADYGIELGGVDGVRVAGNIVAKCSNGGIAISQGSGIDIINNTIAENRDNQAAGIIVTTSTTVLITNNIIADNYTGIESDPDSVPTVTFNDIWGNNHGCNGCADGVLEIAESGWDPFDNISRSPVFVGEGQALFDSNWQFAEFTYVDDDYNLNPEQVQDVPESPCFEAGDPNIDDRDGTISDQGAYGGPDGLYDAPPAEFTLHDGWSEAALSWQKPADIPVAGYRVYRLGVDINTYWIDEEDIYQDINQPSALLADILDPAVTQYVDTDFPAADDMAYFYKVVTVHGANESRPTEEKLFLWTPGLLGEDAGADAAAEAGGYPGCSCSAVGASTRPGGFFSTFLEKLF